MAASSKKTIFYETFEKRSISFKIKAHEDFNHRNVLNIARIKIRMQRPAEAGGERGRFAEVALSQQGTKASRFQAA